MPASPELAVPFRNAMIADSIITSKLIAYKGSFPIFTRRPIPTDVVGIAITISPDIVSTDNDGVSDARPLLTRDVAIYGLNDNSVNYHNVEIIAYRVNDLFHRRRSSLIVPNWGVVSIKCDGPIPAPTDDELTVGRIISVIVQLAALI